MKKSMLIGTTLAGAVLIALAPSSAFAICNGISQPLQHALGGWFENCPDANPVQGFAYVRGSRSTINTGTVDIICEDNNLNGQFGQCPFVDGNVAGDGVITVSTDWGGSTAIVGCPNPTQQAGIGRNIVEIAANDGSSLILSVGYSFDLGQYAVDLAQQDTFPPPPLKCGGGSRSAAGEGMHFTSYNGATLCGVAPTQKVNSDCDPGTWGLTGGGGTLTPTCVTTEIPPTTAGLLYRQEFSCTTQPDLRFGPLWGSAIGTPAADGSFCVPFARPSNTNLCAYIANFGTVDGVAVTNSTSALAVAGSTSPSARALEVRASKNGSSVEITWRTAGEFDLAGFNVQTDAQGGKSRINVSDGLIAAKNALTGGGAEYSVQISMSRFKGGKTVYVESVLRSGQKLLSDPAQF